MHIKRNVNFFFMEINMRPFRLKKTDTCLFKIYLFEINSCLNSKDRIFVIMKHCKQQIYHFIHIKITEIHTQIYIYKKKKYTRENWIKHFIYPTNNAFFHISILYHCMKILAFQNNLFNKKK